jgi:hypothetical protein
MAVSEARLRDGAIERSRDVMSGSAAPERWCLASGLLLMCPFGMRVGSARPAASVRFALVVAGGCVRTTVGETAVKRPGGYRHRSRSG